MLKKTIIGLALLAAMTTASMADSWTTAGVNFRDGPGTSYAKLGTIDRCVLVSITEDSNGWYRIQWSGRWGWVAARYITSDSSYCSGGYSKPAAKSY